MQANQSILVLISANVEWRAVQTILPDVHIQTSPLGEWFTTNLNQWELIFFHGGWGKIAAAASAQYVIDLWQPALLVNLGTCGGFEGEIERGAILVVEKTLVYDIVEQMGDLDEHIAHYTTEIDLSWLPAALPAGVRRSLLVSGDRDLLVEDIPWLKQRFRAIAGDWESAAIAYVARQNHVRTLILRGVTDLVGSAGGEAYGGMDFFIQATTPILSRLLADLPWWLEHVFAKG